MEESSGYSIRSQTIRDTAGGLKSQISRNIAWNSRIATMEAFAGRLAITRMRRW